MVFCTLIPVDLISQNHPVGAEMISKDSIFTGHIHALSDTTTCRSVYDTALHREIYFRVDKMPVYGNSVGDMMDYIRQNLKYPDNQADVSGNVFVRFIVEPTGKLSNIIVVKGLEASFDKEAVEVISKMPDWHPGECKGKKVPVYFNVAVRFTLY